MPPGARLTPRPSEPLHGRRASSYGYDVHSPRCPECSGNLIRIPRRFIDRALNLVVSVCRYRCYRFECKWEGNLRRNRLKNPALPISIGLSPRGGQSKP